MELANALIELWSRKWLVLLVAVVSVVVGILLAFDVKTDPVGLEKKGLQVGTASTQVFIDSRDPAVDTLSSKFDPFSQTALIQRAHTLARIMPSYAIRSRMAERMRVQPEDIAVTPPTDPAVSGTRPEPSGSQRASALVASASDYQLTVEDSTQAPTIDITTQTTDPAQAAALASAAVSSLKQYVTELRRAGVIPLVREQRVPRSVRAREARRDRLVNQRRRQIAVRSLGPPISGTISTGANYQLAVAGALATFVFGCLLILGIVGIGRGVKEARRRRDLAPAPAPGALGAPRTKGLPAGDTPSAPASEDVPPDDDLGDETDAPDDTSDHQPVARQGDT